MNKVRQEEIDQIKENLELYSNLKNIFDNAWLNSHLSIEDRHNKHPLFWVLLDGRCQKLAKNLDILQQKCPKFTRIVNKLKGDKDVLNFHSTLAEVDVMAHYYSIDKDNYAVEYEPNVEENGKKIDGKILVGNESYNLEIFTIHEDETGQQHDALREKVKREINEISQPYVISLGTDLDFTEEHIPNFISFVKKFLESQNSVIEGERYEYTSDGKRLADISFKKYPEIPKGFVGGMHGPARFMNDAGRLKNKILSKLDQLPENAQNVVIINMSYITSDFIDLEEVFFGQSCVNINIETHETSAGRSPNSILNHPKGKNISMIVGYVNNNYNTRRYYVNLSASKPINKDIAQELF